MNEIFAALNTAKGAKTTLWSYSVSLGELIIRVTPFGNHNNAHIVCNVCERIESYESWENLDLVCDFDGEIFQLKDENARFLVVCRSIRVMVDVEPVF